jgi:hypothetical protein
VRRRAQEVEAEARARDFREWLDSVVGDDGTPIPLVVVWREGRATSTGRSDYYSVYVVSANRVVCSVAHRIVAAGYARWCRGDRLRDWIRVPGCGFDKRDDLADSFCRAAGLDRSAVRLQVL